MLRGITRLAIAAPKLVLAVTALVMLGAAVFGIPVAESLSAGGFQDPASESARAGHILRDKFGQTNEKMVIVVTAPGGASGDPARGVAVDIVNRLQRSPWVLEVSSAWTSPPAMKAQLISTDKKSGLILANLKGGEDNAQKYAQKLATQLVHDRGAVTVRAGGMAMAYDEINQQNQRDLMSMEAIAVPLSFAVLVWVFGGLLAAALPIALGVLAIVGTMSVLRLIAFVTEVSTYALDLTAAIGLALAIDYTLLIISRYRDELAEGCSRDQALSRTMASAGRTVVFSATAVALSMAVMALFPMYFLKSVAYAGVAVVAIVAVAAVMVTPAAIVALGPRLDALNVHRLVRRMFSRELAPGAGGPRQVRRFFWYRLTKFVLRHAVPVTLLIVALLLPLAAPFLGVRWGFPDERVLPRSASAHQVGHLIRHDFAGELGDRVSVVLPDAHGLSRGDIDRYAADLSRVPDVRAVTAPNGTFVGGHRAGSPAAPAGRNDGSAYLTIASDAPLYSKASNVQLDRLHDVPVPAGRSAELSGLAQINRDDLTGMLKPLPTVFALIAAIVFALLFALTGSVVLPLKAIACNLLSLTAAFGAMVWIFQDGHLGALGTTATSTLNANVPMLLFCVVFGLSTDYEVFLVSRIREYWLASGLAWPARPTAAQARAANDESTALGVADTGRVITAAALVMSISFAALIPAQVSFMRMFGVGVTLAVLVDATLVRMFLVPAVMHLLGRWNWWAPEPLARLHARLFPDAPGARESALSMQ